MEYIKLKLGQNIYRYGEHVANHKINKKHLWLLNDRGSYSEIEGFYCDLCQRVYVKDSELVYLKRKFNGYQFNVNSIKENGITKIEVARKMITKLQEISRAEHNFVDIYAIVPIFTFDKKIVNFQIPALFCESCQRFFILEPDFEYLNSNGVILCEVVTEDYWKNNEKNRYQLSSESLLYKMGYNVNGQTNLTVSQRRKILTDIVSSGVLTKGEVCSHLDYLIRRSSGQKRLLNAMKKWQQDRQFMANLDLDFKTVNVNKLQVRRKYV